MLEATAGSTGTALAPWAGIAKPFEQNVKLEDAIEKSGLGYTVSTRDLWLRRGIAVPDRWKALVRDDTEDVLGVVGRIYTPVQNREGFEFLNSLVKEDQALFHSAGYLGRGEVVWILMRIPGDVIIHRCPEDRIHKFILYTNRHDGKKRLYVFFTPIREWNWTTLSSGFTHDFSDTSKRTQLGVALKHTTNVRVRLAEAKRILRLTNKFYARFQILADQLAEKEVSEERLDRFVGILYPDRHRKIEATGEIETVSQEGRRDEVKGLFSETGASRMKAIQGTAWAAYNAVVEYEDHGRSIRSSRVMDLEDRKVVHRWMGKGATTKARALALARTIFVDGQDVPLPEGPGEEGSDS